MKAILLIVMLVVAMAGCGKEAGRPVSNYDAAQGHCAGTEWDLTDSKCGLIGLTCIGPGLKVGGQDVTADSCEGKLALQLNGN